MFTWAMQNHDVAAAADDDDDDGLSYVCIKAQEPSPWN